MRWLIGLLALAAACGDAPCDEAVLLEPCPDCGPGEVRGGMAVPGGGGLRARPAGGVARIGCDTRLFRYDAAFALEEEIGLYQEGRVSLQAIGPDDTAYLVDRAIDPGDRDDLVAVARSGTEIWRIATERGADTFALVRIAVAGDRVLAYGGADGGPLALGGASADGLYVIQLGAADGLVRWSWSSGQEAAVRPEELSVAPADDGSVVISGTFEGTLELGGTAPALISDGESGFIALLDPNGLGVWARQLDGPALDGVHALARAPGGSLAIAGTFAGGALDLGGVLLEPAEEGGDQFVAVLEPEGTTRWGARLGGIGELVSAIAATDTSVVVGGAHEGALSFGGEGEAQDLDGYIASLEGGAVTWLVQIGGPGYQLVSGLGATGTALHASVEQHGAQGGAAASLEFRDIALEGEGALYLELAP